DARGELVQRVSRAEDVALAAAGRIHVTLAALEARLHGEIRLCGCGAAYEQSADDGDGDRPGAPHGFAPAAIHCRIMSIVACGSGGPPNGICAPTGGGFCSSFCTRKLASGSPACTRCAVGSSMLGTPTR